MRGILTAAIFLSFSLSLDTPPITPSALENDPTGWTDITPTGDLKGWTILPIPPTGTSTPQWRVQDRALVCSGTGGHDWIRFDRVLKDFVVHVEWRFTPVDSGKGYNSGVFVRNNADATIWHQAQVGGGAGGFFFGMSPVNGQPTRFTLKEKSMTDRVKPAGDWNTYEITCQGSKLSLWTNGTTTSEFSDCAVLSGYFGLEAEGYRIEFRNIKLKEL